MLHKENLATVAIVLLLVSASFAEESRTIKVTATGRVPMMPSDLELQLTVAGSSELAKDAAKKYDQALKQVREAFAKLDVEGLKLEAEGVSVKQIGQNQQMMFVNGQQQNETSQPVTFGRSVRVTVPNIGNKSESEISQLLVRVIDTAKDSGAAVQGQMNQLARIYGTQFSNAMAFFVVNGVDAAREEAYEQAMEKAKRRAERLARLSNSKITRVHTISESFQLPVDSESQQMRMIYSAYGWQNNNEEKKRVLSSEFKKVDIAVKLTVEFEIE